MSTRTTNDDWGDPRYPTEPSDYDRGVVHGAFFALVFVLAGVGAVRLVEGLR